MKTATFLRDVSHNFRGRAELFRVDPPMPWNCKWMKNSDLVYTRTTKYVVVSAVHAYSDGPETFIFPAYARAKRDGERRHWVKNFMELDGSFRGEKNIDKALENAGYTVIRGE